MLPTEENQKDFFFLCKAMTLVKKIFFIDVNFAGLLSPAKISEAEFSNLYVMYVPTSASSGNVCKRFSQTS